MGFLRAIWPLLLPRVLARLIYEPLNSSNGRIVFQPDRHATTWALNGPLQPQRLPLNGKLSPARWAVGIHSDAVEFVRHGGLAYSTDAQV